MYIFPRPMFWTEVGVQGSSPVAPLLVVAYGAGVDSTAMLIQMWRLGIRPDLILMADTGNEKPQTYAYIPIMNAWLRGVGFPEIVMVRRSPTRSRKTGEIYRTLEENCLANHTLPSLAFGRKACSLKWKREPQDKFCNSWAPAREVWKRGDKIVKLIGYDAGPKDMRRSKIEDDAKYTYRYPLREWGWTRERCIAEIEAAGLPVPDKSACDFCPASQPHEIETGIRRDRNLGYRIIEMERRAMPNLRKIEGLWRKTTKKRPGSMTTFVLQVFAQIDAEHASGARRSTALRVIQSAPSAGCGA